MTAFANSTDDTGNMVDRASHSAEHLLETTRQGANSVIDSVTEKIHAVRDSASPALDRLLAPVDAVVARTRSAPVTSLLLAAAVGATLMALVALLHTSPKR